jgi:hypothetical protein
MHRLDSSETEIARKARSLLLMVVINQSFYFLS